MTSLLALTGSASRIEHLPLPSDDPTQRRPVIDLAQAELGWQPTVTLDQGLPATVAHFRQLLGLAG